MSASPRVWAPLKVVEPRNTMLPEALLKVNRSAEARLPFVALDVRNDAPVKGANRSPA